MFQARRSRTPPASHGAGVLAGFLAALSVSCDGLLVKLASRDGANLSTIMVFKSGLGAGCLVAMMALLALVSVCVAPGGAREALRVEWPSRTGLAHILFGGVMSAVMSLGFTLAFYFATSANVLALTALAPIWTALFTRPVLGLPLPWRTIWANAGALLGTAVVVGGVVLEARGSVRQSARNPVLGTFFALTVSLSSAAVVTTIRSAHQRAPGTRMLLASLLGMVLATMIGLALVPLLQPAGEPLLPADARAIAWLAISGFFVVALALVLITLAARLASPAEVSLILQVEGLLGPISTFAFLGEVPSAYSLGGGSFVLLMVATHEALALYDGRRAASRRHGDAPAAVESAPAAAAAVKALAPANPHREARVFVSSA
ncbi:hypothetical protein KFE25_006797 [Diacronema lutheri]|uniref:EamA domain-containing protein n=3 Tax=Diacronema lutheri TaxID=2081491 RepID=A0A8J5XTQ1_DIALT|nr:hypothetical protein KFE25_006797 [Diacronema lutheri]